MDSRVEKEKLKKILTANLYRCDNPLQHCSETELNCLIDHLIKNNVTFTAEAYWKDNIVMTNNPITGRKDNPFREGYTCSKCGKYKYYKTPFCDGCKSKMMK